MRYGKLVIIISDEGNRFVEVAMLIDCLAVNKTYGKELHQ